jgi:para-nitrobenzyl esterase
MMLLLLVVAFSDASNLMKTTLGTVRGYTDGSVTYFKGIPFAAPPTGANRFRPPQPAQPWSGIFDASQPNDVMCTQFHTLGWFTVGQEDCLYLDVYRPANTSSGDALPIMVWIYGGGWVFGDKLEFGLYEATHLVNAAPHIHVAMNYRLGALGFFAHADLLAQDGTTGNYGLQDQQAALRWVQANAHALGGDASRVTIFGESAGAFSVCAHLVMKSSAGLFSAAIGESGDCDAGPFFRPLALAANFSAHYAGSLGCSGANTVACMRQLDTAAVFNGNLYGAPLLAPIMPWAAVIDGAALLDIPLNMMRQNHSDLNRVPYVLGTNENEGAIFVPALPLMGFPLPLTLASFTGLINYLFRNQTITKQALALYDHFNTYEDAAAMMTRDWFFVCPTRATATAWREVVGQPAYLYHFTFIPKNWPDADIIGDYHAIELFILYRNGVVPLLHTFDARDLAMSAVMQQYWTSFAATHVPSGGPIAWPQYNASSRANIRLDDPLLIEYKYKADVCETLWDALPPQPW